LKQILDRIVGILFVKHIFYSFYNILKHATPKSEDKSEEKEGKTDKYETTILLQSIKASAVLTYVAFVSKINIDSEVNE
jgi:hypothetical protein